MQVVFYRSKSLGFEQQMLGQESKSFRVSASQMGVSSPLLLLFTSQGEQLWGWMTGGRLPGGGAPRGSLQALPPEYFLF